MKTALTLAVVLAALASACKGKPVVAPARDQDLVVLLPDSEGGTVGAASVSNALGAIQLTGPYEASETRVMQAPGQPMPIAADRVTEIFGAALDGMPLAPLVFQLEFDFDSDELTTESRALFPEILRGASGRPAVDVSVIGHTDTVGDATANYALGLKRATAVRALLLQAGFEASSVEASSHGEADLRVATPDNTREARNRRVEITVR